MASVSLQRFVDLRHAVVGIITDLVDRAELDEPDRIVSELRAAIDLIAIIDPFDHALGTRQ